MERPETIPNKFAIGRVAAMSRRTQPQRKSSSVDRGGHTGHSKWPAIDQLH
jgi:hypothetical protein